MISLDSVRFVAWPVGNGLERNGTKGSGWCLGVDVLEFVRGYVVNGWFKLVFMDQWLGYSQGWKAPNG